MDTKNILLLGFVLFLVLHEVYSETVCSECICPVEYNPICARQQVTGKLRGFSSKCVLKCSNQCRKNKFEYVKDGRCGNGNVRKYITFDVNNSTTTTTKKPARRPSLLFI